MTHATERSNEQWLSELGQPGRAREAALADLRARLVRGLRFALDGRAEADDAFLEDVAQDALLKVLDKLNSFKGRSRFTTWAQSIAVHTAFSELRRKRWQDLSLDGLSQETHFQPEDMVDSSVEPERQVVQERILSVMHRVINEELTERQREGLMTELDTEMPLDELARRMDTNRNALYKLLYDARQKLKRGMLNAGVEPEAVRAAFEL